MKKFVAVSLLAAATTIAGAQAAPAGQQQGTEGGQQQVVIKDQAEYQAYTAAVGQTDPAAQAQALESFLQQYPNTVVKKDVLERLLADYQKAGNQAKMADTAQRILQNDPNNEQAALVVAYVKSTQAQQLASQPTPNQDQVKQAYTDAAQAAQVALNGLDKLEKPASVDEASFQQQKNQIATVMNGTIGLASFLNGNYQAAVPALFKAVQLNPADYANMYYLGVSMAKPVTRQMMYSDPAQKTQLLAGVFWLLKASATAQGPAKQQFTSMAQYYYNRYHGSQEGFQQAQQQAATMTEPSDALKITPVPSPAEQAAQVLANTPPDQILVKEGFDTWASILQLAQPADQQKVWDATKGKPIDISGTVINATPNQIQLAVSDTAQNEKRADVTVSLKSPLTTPPTAGTSDYEVIGIAETYTPSPFSLTLANGAPKAKAPAAKTPAKRSGAPRRPASRPPQ
jgi:hypothetical protein